MSTLDKIKNVWTQYFPPPPDFSPDDVPRGSQTGRVFIVTGGNTGLGYELCKLLYATGAIVYMGARSTEKAEEAIETIEKNVASAETGQLKLLLVDLSDLRSVKDAAETFARQESRLDVLWNNAGMGPNTVKFTDRTAQGLDPLLGVHCVAAHFFTELLLPQLRAAAISGPQPSPARVIWLTSGFADTNSPDNGIDISALNTGLEDRILNYAASKVGAWIISREFARRHGKDGIISLPLNPGNCVAGSYKGTGAVLMLIMKLLLLYPPSLGARTQFYAGLSPDVTLEKNGIYIIPWGRTRSDNAIVRKDILKAMIPEEEGGLGYGKKLWEWSEAHWKGI